MDLQKARTAAELLERVDRLKRVHDHLERAYNRQEIIPLSPVTSIPHDLIPRIQDLLISVRNDLEAQINSL